MFANYRIIKDGNPVAWFVHSEHCVACLQEMGGSDSGFSVEFCCIGEKYYSMLVSKHGQLMFTDRSFIEMGLGG